MSRSHSSSEVLAALKRLGFVEVGQRGSHLKLRRSRGDATETVIVKHPSKDIPQGTFASILKQAGVSREELERHM